MNYSSFNLRKVGVQVEVLERIGEIEPYGQLREAWVIIRGIPPKWCVCRVFAQMASSFGLLIEVDGASLFKTFYESVRIKIACIIPCKIPLERLLDMNKELFLISEVESFPQEMPKTISGDDGNEKLTRRRS